MIPTISRDVRGLLLITSVVGVVLNIVIVAIGKKKAEGALGIVFLTLSGFVSLFQLAKPNSRPFLNMFMDAFFAIALSIIYVLVLVLSSVLRRHIVGVYANIACLVSSVIHGYAFIKVAYYFILARIEAQFPLSMGFCPHCSTRSTENYKPTHCIAQEPRGDRDDDSLAGDDEGTPLYRDSEDTAVMKV